MKLSFDEVESVCREAAEGRVLVPANFNAANQIVISGHADAVARAVRIGEKRGAVVKLLEVSAPFHSPLMAPAAERLRRAMEKIAFKDPEVPVVQNVDAKPSTSGSRMVDQLTHQVTAPVLWQQSVQRLAEMGVVETIEIGPGRVLSSLVRRAGPRIKTTAVQAPADIAGLATRAAKVDGQL
jgi:[acyl-carrier-protein] S-malonyltransferase